MALCWQRVASPEHLGGNCLPFAGNPKREAQEEEEDGAAELRSCASSFPHDGTRRIVPLRKWIVHIYHNYNPFICGPTHLGDLPDLPISDVADLTHPIQPFKIPGSHPFLHHDSSCPVGHGQFPQTCILAMDMSISQNPCRTGYSLGGLPSCNAKEAPLGSQTMAGLVEFPSRARNIISWK